MRGLDVREGTQNQLPQHFGFMGSVCWGFKIGAGVTSPGL